MSITHTLFDWYKAYRRDHKPKDALDIARYALASEQRSAAILAALSPSSRQRIGGFIHDFIRSEEVTNLISERNADFINEPERAARIANAPEDSCEGETHAETIEDWRDAFSYWLMDRHTHRSADRFEAAVLAHFTLVELWHDFNGTLNDGPC